MAVAHLVTTLNEALEVGDSVWKIYKFRRLVNRCWIQLFFLFFILGYPWLFSWFAKVIFK